MRTISCVNLSIRYYPFLSCSRPIDFEIPPLFVCAAQAAIVHFKLSNSTCCYQPGITLPSVTISTHDGFGRKFVWMVQGNTSKHGSRLGVLLSWILVLELGSLSLRLSVIFSTLVMRLAFRWRFLFLFAFVEVHCIEQVWCTQAWHRMARGKREVQRHRTWIWTWTCVSRFCICIDPTGRRYLVHCLLSGGGFC